MKCLRVFCMCCAISLICSFPCFALQSSSFEVYSTDPVVDQELDEDYFWEISRDNPIYDEEFDAYELEPVVDDPSFSVLPGRLRAALPVIGDEPPSNPLFYGSCWVTGYDSNLGEVTLYYPLSCKEDSWAVDPNGYLYNISGGSISGYCDGVYNNSVSCSNFNYPTYRLSSGSSYTTYTLYLTPSNSNMEIATSMEPAQNVTQLLPFVYVALLGVIIVCFMKRS